LIYKQTKRFPTEEKFSLTDQIRRSSRSVCTTIGEAYRKRQYEAHFISKSSDADMENTETQTWLDFAQACNYLDETAYKELLIKSEEVGRMLNHMHRASRKICETDRKNYRAITIAYCFCLLPT
jgi:four helix bundle protein